MKEEDLTKVGTEGLQKRAKMMKFAVGAMGFSMVLMVIAGIILSIKKGFSALSFTAFGFFPLIIIFSMQLKKISEELKRRA